MNQIFAWWQWAIMVINLIASTIIIIDKYGPALASLTRWKGDDKAVGFVAKIRAFFKTADTNPTPKKM